MKRDLHFVAAVVIENDKCVSVRALSHFLGQAAYEAKENYRHLLNSNEKLCVIEG